MTPRFTDPDRQKVYADALAAGVSAEVAALIAGRVGTDADGTKRDATPGMRAGLFNAAAEIRTATDVERMCRVVGAPQLAPEMVRAGVDSQRGAEILRRALPTSGKDRLRLNADGIHAARLAITAVGYYSRRSAA